MKCWVLVVATTDGTCSCRQKKSCSKTSSDSAKHIEDMVFGRSKSSNFRFQATCAFVKVVPQVGSTNFHPKNFAAMLNDWIDIFMIPD